MADDHLRLTRYQQCYHRREMYQCLQLLVERSQGPFVEVICGSAEAEVAAGGGGGGEGLMGQGGAGTGAGEEEGLAGSPLVSVSPVPVLWLARSSVEPSRALGLCSALVWS